MGSVASLDQSAWPVGELRELILRDWVVWMYGMVDFYPFVSLKFYFKLLIEQGKLY